MYQWPLVCQPWYYRVCTCYFMRISELNLTNLALMVQMNRIYSGELSDSAKAIEITGAEAQARTAQVSDLCLNTIPFSKCASTALRLENPITPLRVHYVHYVCLRVEISHTCLHLLVPTP